MKKTLISVDNLDEHICRELGRLYVDGNMILTAGARDELTRRGIAIVRSADAGAEHAAAPCKAPAKTGAACAAGGHGQEGCHENGHGEALPAEVEDVLVGVASILKQECGINDPEELKTATLRVFKALRQARAL